MEFYIKKNATLPIIKLQVVKNGRNEYNNFMELIEVSSLFFSMVDIETGIPKITSRPAGFVEKTSIEPNADPEYYLYYQFTNRDTSKVGRYEAQFMLRNSDGVLILPIREKLYINVQDSFIADDLPYDSCYVSEFPCCINGPYITTTTTTPVPTPSTTPTLTPTPTPTIPSGFPVIILTEVMSGSVIFNFTVILPMTLDIEYILDITKEFKVLHGLPIVITANITIPPNQISGETRVTIDDDITRIDGESTTISSNQSTHIYDVFTEIEEVRYVGFIPPKMVVTPTPTPTLTPTPTVSAVLSREHFKYGKSTKQIITSQDIYNFEWKSVTSTINQHLKYPSIQGYSYLMVPSYMEQPTLLRDSADGCNGFIIPFVRVDDVEIIDFEKNSNILYYVYRSFVSTSSKIDVWICE
jgi:hypothetical protein